MFRSAAPLQKANAPEASGVSACQRVVHGPVAFNLPEDCASDDACGNEHFVGGLKHALEV